MVLAVILLSAPGCFRGVDEMSLLEMRQHNAMQDLDVYESMAVHIDIPVTLEDAIQYALEHNLLVWIAKQEKTFQEEMLTQSKLRMLPSVDVNGEYSNRSEYIATSSVSINSGQESLESSYSAEKRTNKFDVTATWDMIDFGVSYLRSRQASDRTLISGQQLRRQRQQLAFDVTRAYWQAVAAREAAQMAEGIRTAIEQMRQAIQQQVQEKTITEMDALKKETPLLEQLLVLRRYESSYQSARIELGRLMGLPIGSDFEIAEETFDDGLLAMVYNLSDLEQEALLLRPELYEQDLEERISRNDARIAITRMFPSLATFFNFDYDDNKFLYVNSWHTIGLRASWNLLSIPRRLSEHKAAELQEDLISKRRIAQAVGILTQLHLAVIEYRDAMDQVELQSEIAMKRKELVAAVEANIEQGTSHQGELVEYQLKDLTARSRYLMTFAKIMVAQARIVNTVGRDPVISIAKAEPEPDQVSEQTSSQP